MGKPIKCKLYLITQWGNVICFGEFKSIKSAMEYAKYTWMKNYKIVKTQMH